jgi:hypothetical protein
MSHICDIINKLVMSVTSGRLIRSSVRFGFSDYVGPDGKWCVIPGYHYQVEFVSGRYTDNFYPGLSWINQ